MQSKRVLISTPHWATGLTTVCGFGPDRVYLAGCHHPTVAAAITIDIPMPKTRTTAAYRAAFTTISTSTRPEGARLKSDWVDVRSVFVDYTANSCHWGRFGIIHGGPVRNSNILRVDSQKPPRVKAEALPATGSKTFPVAVASGSYLSK